MRHMAGTKGREACGKPNHGQLEVYDWRQVTCAACLATRGKK